MDPEFSLTLGYHVYYVATTNARTIKALLNHVLSEYERLKH